jgi:hypothetical protein
MRHGDVTNEATDSGQPARPCELIAGLCICGGHSRIVVPADHRDRAMIECAAKAIIYGVEASARIGDRRLLGGTRSENLKSSRTADSRNSDFLVFGVPCVPCPGEAVFTPAEGASGGFTCTHFRGAMTGRVLGQEHLPGVHVVIEHRSSRSCGEARDATRLKVGCDLGIRFAANRASLDAAADLLGLAAWRCSPTSLPVRCR